MTNPILFLDIDGVLNNVAVFRDRRFGPAPLDHECVRRLHYVVTKTDCRIVLSSSWREMEGLEAKLAGDFVFHIYGNEPPCGNIRHEDRSTIRIGGETPHRRGDEIAEWLSRHPEVTRYAIVDDDADMRPEQMPFFVQTNFEKGGLLHDHARRLIDILADPARREKE